MRKIILRILMFIFILNAVISLCVIFRIQTRYSRSEEAIEALKAEKPDSPKDGNMQDKRESAYERSAENVDFLIALHEKNPDCAAWITIEDTAIDYPVMYRPSSVEYYLKRNFDGEYDVCGLPYIAENCDFERCDNLIIYGHHMKNGSMFAALDDYKDKEFYENHKFITLTEKDGVKTYQIICVFVVSVYTGHDFEYYGFSQAQTESDFERFIEGCRRYQLYETGEEASYGDKLITLSTCEYTHTNGRVVVVGKLISL